MLFSVFARTKTKQKNMKPVETISKLKIWQPIAIVSGIFAAVTIAFAAKEVYQAYHTSKKKDEVKKGLEDVKETIVAETTEAFSGCGGCSGAAGGNTKTYPMKEGFSSANAQLIKPVNVYSGASGQLINPNSLVPQVYG